MSKLTKEEALEILNNHALHFHDIDEPFVFPIFDKVVSSMTYVQNGNYALAEYSFRKLICVAYDLKPNE